MEKERSEMVRRQIRIFCSMDRRRKLSNLKVVMGREDRNSGDWLPEIGLSESFVGDSNASPDVRQL